MDPLDPRAHVYVDPHHHFWDAYNPDNPNALVQKHLLHRIPEREPPEREEDDLEGTFSDQTPCVLHREPTVYLPEHYEEDLDGLFFGKTVHVEVLPDDGAKEAEWISYLAVMGRCRATGLVAACDLAADDAAAKLEAIVKSKAGKRVRGIRWILNYAGPLAEGEEPVVSKATWHRVPHDYLSGEDEDAKARWEKGYGLLVAHNLCFDLQCNPHQLAGAAALCARHPSVPVVLDHFGHPRHLTGDAAADEPTLAVWRAGMTALAALPHAHVKLSMFGYAMPNWWKDPVKEEQLKILVRWVIELFGAKRCMFASNWPVDGVDGLTLPDMYSRCAPSTTPRPLAPPPCSPLLCR